MKFSELNKRKEKEISEKEKSETNKTSSHSVTDEVKIMQPSLPNPLAFISEKVSDSSANSEILEQNKKNESQELKFSIKKVEVKEEDFSDVLSKENELKENARILYDKSVLLMKNLYDESDNSYLEKYIEFKYLVNEFYKQLSLNPFFPYVLRYLTPWNYLVSHSINVSIICMGMAKQANMSEEEIKNIGIAALFHDMGMKKYLNMARKEKQFDKGEMDVVKNHVQDTIDKLDNVIDFEPEIKLFISNVLAKIHERYDGSGYPQGLLGDEIDLYSGIIALADVYEAMTHKRPWRNAYELPTVMRTFVGEFKGAFHPKALKLIISFLSMYPVGSIVRLSTGEIGVVELLNYKNFTRPLIKIVMDGEFNNVENFYINLMEYPLTQIENEIKYKELAEKNSKFLIDFEISSLWVEW